MALDKSNDPSTPSLAHEALASCWEMVRAVREGAKAVKERRERFLPKYPSETPDEYKRRLECAPWRPEFEDSLRAISSKPFSKEAKLVLPASADMEAFAENVDGRGNNLHTFARDFFESGVSFGLAGVLVDFPRMEPGATLADERRRNARPYWVPVYADEIIALRTERQGAREVVTHLRLRETDIEIDGFAEERVEKIRQIEPGGWVLYRKVRDGAVSEWRIEDQGALTLPEVPFVIFATNDRVGPQYVRPPLLDLVEMQIELYRFMSGEEQIYTMAGSPMLTANGMAAPEGGGSVEVGPGRVLYAPGMEGIQTSWEYIQPAADNLRAISDKAKAIIDDMRRLAMQPMLPKTGVITATASGVEASKAHSTVQSWANDLRDALENAFAYTAQWMGSTEQPEVEVHTDFAVGMQGVEEVRVLLDARKGGLISEETFWEEMMRRGVLSPSFDADEERGRLEVDDPTEEEINATLLPPITAE